MKTKKISETFEFKQKTWVNPYFDLNAELRYKAENEFQTTICKSLNTNFTGILVYFMEKNTYNCKKC